MMRLLPLLTLLLVLAGCAATPAARPATPRPVSGSAPAPFPTLTADLWRLGSGQQTAMRLPNEILQLAIAVHPNEGWPVLGLVEWNGPIDAPRTVFVRAFNPTAGRWGAALQLDIGPASVGPNRFSAVTVAIQGDRTIHAVWGSDDARPGGGDFTLGIWTSRSTDYGDTWSAPESIAQGCFQPLGMAATPDGQLAVLLNCSSTDDTVYPAMLVRTADGRWLPMQRLDIPSWYGAQGAVVVRGDGPDARAVALLTGPKPSMAPGTAYLARKYLINSADGWEIVKRTADAGALPIPDRFTRPQGIAFDRTRADVPAREREGMLFTWVDADAGRAYALRSFDAGSTWGSIEPMVYAGDTDPQRIHFVAPAYDPAADRLVALWACCGGDMFTPGESTHFASWSVPDSQTWQPNQLPGTTDPRIPLVDGARSAFATVAAQTPNTRLAWIAWVDMQRQVEVRSLDLNHIIPVDQYPAATPEVTQ